MDKVAERKIKALTAKKRSLYSILQTLYDFSMSLDLETNRKTFQAMNLTLDSTVKSLGAVVDEIIELKLKVNEDYVPDYSWLPTINEFACYIRMAAQKLKKVDAQTTVAPLLRNYGYRNSPELSCRNFRGKFVGGTLSTHYIKV